MTVEPVDLHLRVEPRHASGQTTLELDLTFPSGRAQLFRLRAGDRSRPRLTTHVDPFTNRLFDDLEALLRGSWSGGDQLLAQEVDQRLRRLGKNLFRKIFPADFRELFARPDLAGASLLIETDETSIPWELLHTLGDDGDFLCRRFRLGRWLSGPTAPASTIEIRRVLAIDGARVDRPDLGLRRLPNASAEIAVLDAIARQRSGVTAMPVEPPSYEHIMARLERGGFQLLHFAGHGVFAADRSADEAALVLEGQNLVALDWVDKVERRMRLDRPLVFLNACRTGRRGEALIGLGGWPETLVQQCACGAVVAPQWAVRDRRAQRFASAFYRSLDRGLPLGEAVRRARSDDPADGTRDDADLVDSSSLAYVFYGHPNGIVRWLEPAASPTSVQRSTATGRSTSTSPPVEVAVEVGDRLGSPQHDRPSPRRLRSLLVVVALLVGFGWLATWLVVQRASPEQEALADSLERAAVVAVQQRDFETARVRLERVVEIVPERHSAWSSLGVVYRTLDQASRGVEALERAVALAPAEPLYRLNLGNVLSDLGDLDAAATAYREATRLDADYAGAWNNLGLVELERGRLDAAAGALETAAETVRLGDDGVLVAVVDKNRGRLSLARGDVAAAIRFLERAAEGFEALRGEVYPEALYHLAMAHAEDGAVEEACAAWRRHAAGGSSSGPPPEALDCGALDAPEPAR